MLISHTGVRAAYLALLHAAVISASSSPMLAFVRPPGRRVMLGLPPRLGWSHARVVTRHSGGGFGGGSPDPLLPREASPQQRRALLSLPLDGEVNFSRSRRALRRRVSIPKMKAKGVDTASSPTPAAGNWPPPAASASSAAQIPAANDAEISVGMRIRLRDTGRLGTVVGKKAGGWWIVELLEGWGGNIGASGGGGSGVSGVGGDAAAEISNAKMDGATRNAGTVAAGGGPVSTRRVNMELLGDAYASSSPEESPSIRVATTLPQQAVTRRRRSTASASTRSRKGTKSAPQKKVHIEETTSSPTAAVRGAAGAIKLSAVEAPMKARTAGGEVPPTGEETTTAVAIHSMSTEGLAHAEMTEWLIFSDLHVSPTSLEVCLEALERINEEAMKRPTCGIAFLGDFWHARGSLKVDLLVPVMKRLATWTRPVVMIPGNHDQVTLGGGMHALTPLQFAFSDPKQALVLSGPTLFLDALWIPHRRNNVEMEGLLRSEEARDARAIFCHVDIKGACMNDGVSSHSGIPRSAFPEMVPTFSGHFHKPHTVGDGFIRYIGSPYQTCLAESGQSKALVVLDAATWAEKDTVPLDIGRRFFRVKGDDQPLPDVGETSPGDRVVWTVSDAASEDVRLRAEALQQELVEVEIREAPRPLPAVAPNGVAVLGVGGTLAAAGGINRIGHAAQGEEDWLAAGAGAAAAATSFPDSTRLSPEALFRTYLEREREGGKNVSEEVERLGFKLIKDQGQQTPSKETRQEDRHTSLDLHSIQLKNFGPFRDEVMYPLDERGVVLLRGRNLDDSGADSNGAGKTTLAMSALWALAGVVDARPVSDGRVADVVHEGTRLGSSSSSSSSVRTATDGDSGGKKETVVRRSTVAEATITGTLNGKPLWLKRRKGARVNQLFLKHDGKDLTRQIAKETQEVLEEDLGLSPHVLVRGVFQGQHHVNGLLESTDAQLKEELALLVPMDMWQDLASQSRATARRSGEDAARFRERAVTRREDLARLAEELERAQAEVANGSEERSVNDTTALGIRNAMGDHGGADATVTPPSSSSSSSSPSSLSLGKATGGATREENHKETSLRTSGIGGMSKEGRGEEGTAAAEAAERARGEARRAREDAEAAEEALRLLRAEQERLGEGWADQKTRLLGEAKVAQERVSFVRRDVQQAKGRLKELESAAARVEDEWARLRDGDPELWGPLLVGGLRGDGTTADGQRRVMMMAAAAEVETAAAAATAAEAAAASCRACLADAQAASKHADEAVRAHAALAMVGEGACYACGQPVSGSTVRERGEVLQVAQNVASASLDGFQREASAKERLLQLTRSRSTLLERMVSALEERSKVEEELRAQLAELRRVEDEGLGADREGEEHAHRENLLRREWAGKMKAAEWALKAHRDKQIFAQHELEEAVARDAELQLQWQAQQAERQRLLQAEEVAKARLREVESQVERVRDELAEVEEKERTASALKATSNALAEHLGVRGVQNFVFRDAVNQLQANVARYLYALSDGALLLRLSMDGDRVVKRAGARAADGGFRDRSLSQLSGGQWRRASLALELAFVELARQRSRFSCNLLVLDEVLSQLDSYGRARVATMLRGLAHGRPADMEADMGATQAVYSTILVVLQDLPAEELQESFDCIDEVVKHRDSSSVVVDGYS